MTESEINKVKAAVRRRDHWRCTKCGMRNRKHRERYGERLNVHRLEPGGPYSMANCVTLCVVCHGAAPEHDRATGNRHGSYTHPESRVCGDRWHAAHPLESRAYGDRNRDRFQEGRQKEFCFCHK